LDGQPRKEIARIRTVDRASTTAAGYAVPSPGRIEEAATIEGSIREIDLDERTFIVRGHDTAHETHCKVLVEYGRLLEQARDRLGHRVRVLGKVSGTSAGTRAHPLQVESIKMLD
ncbi:MAG TPA: hypothetical protein VG013_11485, partial [Gemmataceae bacterium]|nr:hypothetical protein [Gemmataceae bacterium]